MALEGIEAALLGLFWPRDNGQIHAQSIGQTPFQTVSYLDFSHLSQTGLDRSAPIRPKRAHLKVATHPALSDVGDEAGRAALRKGLLRRLLGRFAESVSCSFGTVSRSPPRAHERRRFQPLRRLLRLFACWSPAPTRKKSYGHPRNLKPCGLLCSPMAKVELIKVLRSSHSLGPMPVSVPGWADICCLRVSSDLP